MRATLLKYYRGALLSHFATPKPETYIGLQLPCTYDMWAGFSWVFEYSKGVKSDKSKPSNWNIHQFKHEGKVLWVFEDRFGPCTLGAVLIICDLVTKIDFKLNTLPIHNTHTKSRNFHTNSSPASLILCPLGSSDRFWIASGYMAIKTERLILSTTYVSTILTNPLMTRHGCDNTLILDLTSGLIWQKHIY